MSDTLDIQIRRLAFWSALLVLVTMVISFVLPLDVPEGHTATHGERVAWLLEHRGIFILAWINQIAAMTFLTLTFGGFAWLARTRSPLAALLAALTLLCSFVAFIIPKFIAVWTIPLLATAIGEQATGHEMADALLLILNVSTPFSLYTSFDYLGFWLYAVFGLLVAPALYGPNLLSKLSAVSFGIYGIAYHAVVAGILLGAITADAIETFALSVTVLLIGATLLAIGMFRPSSSPAVPTASSLN